MRAAVGWSEVALEVEMRGDEVVTVDEVVPAMDALRNNRGLRLKAIVVWLFVLDGGPEDQCGSAHGAALRQRALLLNGHPPGAMRDPWPELQALPWPPPPGGGEEYGHSDEEDSLIESSPSTGSRAR